MRKACQLTVVLVAVLCLAGAAQGAILTSASFGFPGRTPLGVFPPITATGVGNSVGLGATATLGANILQGTVQATGVTSAPPVEGVWLTLTGHAAGSFTAAGGPGGGLGGAMTLGGQARITAYSGYVNLVKVPLSVAGKPGGFVYNTGGGGTIVQAYGTGWTTGVRTLMVPATTISGGTTPPGTVTASGADLRTAIGAGTLVLITPIFVRSNLGRDIPLFATLTLNYVPEPGTLLLVGCGIAGLALRGRNRRWPR